MEQKVIISTNLNTEIATAISECEHDRVFVLCDWTTHEACWPLIKDFFRLRDANVITIASGDKNKDVETLQAVWMALVTGGADRHSLLLNLGGGMVTDLGGFAASTFKRGIDFINIPTTLLAMVDASVGGKTGINFDGLKNEVGVFRDARYVIIDTSFLSTLDTRNLRSGYAEMLKHGLISDEDTWAELLSFPLDEPDLARLGRMVGRSVEVKERFVKEDPLETGIRKALNFGHTFGHAIESLSLAHASSPDNADNASTPLLHGYAVAYGLVCELYLSCIKAKFPEDKMRQTVSFIRKYYGDCPITCDDYPALLSLMKHDKKNIDGQINFTLLGGIGDIYINRQASADEIRECFDFLREG